MATPGRVAAVLWPDQRVPGPFVEELVAFLDGSSAVADARALVSS